MIAHKYFPGASRIRKQVIALVEAGNEVDVICLRDSGETPRDTYGEGVRVFRMPVGRNRSAGKIGYLLEYARFFIHAACQVARLHGDRHYGVIEVHGPPEELVFSAFMPKLRGAAIMLDIHDCTPPLFSDKYGIAQESVIYRVLERLELASCRFADRILVAADPFKDRLVSHGIPAEKIAVVLNSPEAELAPQEKAPLILVYAGSVFDRYGFEAVLEGIAKARPAVPEVQLHVYGSDVHEEYRGRLKTLAEKLGIADIVAFNDYVAPISLRSIFDSADIGLCSLRRSCHIDLTYATKVFEYLRFGLPVLCTRTPALETLFEHSDVRFYECSSPDDFAKALVKMAAEIPRKSLARRPNLLPSQLSWDVMGRRVVEVHDQLALSSQPWASQASIETEAR